MKIALMSFEYPPETGFGGIGTYTWYHARALVKLGHEVHVLAGATDPTPLRTVELDGVLVHRFRSDGRMMRSLRGLDRFRLWWTKSRLQNAMCMYRGLTSLCKQHRFDVIEMPECGAEGALVNHLISRPTVVKLHSPSRLIMPFYDVRRADITLCSLVERIGIRGATAFTSCSRFLAEEARDKLRIRMPIRVVPNGIDLELFDAADQVDFRSKFDIPKDLVTVLFAGRMEQRKGIHLCKEIAASILEQHEVAFVFAGQDLFGYMADTLLPYLRTRKLRGSVHYLGRLGLLDMRSCVRQSDIFLIPSLWENCPYSCLEAMAAGRAIVSSHQGGMPELIRDGENGMMADLDEPRQFVACLERLIEDEGLRQRLGRAARRTIERFHRDVRIARITSEFYEECLRN